MRGVSRRTEERDARLARYAELRESGILPADACRKVGVAYSSIGSIYERWYRRTHIDVECYAAVGGEAVEGRCWQRGHARFPGVA